jgi:hypothetical protein
MISPFDEELEFVKDLTWEEVFEIWRKDEEHRDHWKHFWKEKGFDSWEEWRMRYAEAFKLPERDWKLYFIKSPLTTVPKFRGGPFKSWVERFYEGRNAPTFAELAKHPEVRSHKGILDIIKHFPPKTTISGVLTDDGITIVEGMHRASAVAIAATQHDWQNNHLTIALGSRLPGELPIVGKMRKEEE